MAARKGGGHGRPVKGFRPGKEPAQLRKQRARAELGKNASWAQKRTVEAIAGRTPEEVRAMVRTWSRGLMSGGALLAIGGVFLYGPALWVGAVAHLVAAAFLFLGYRLGKQGAGLAEMAKNL